MKIIDRIRRARLRRRVDRLLEEREQLLREQEDLMYLDGRWPR